jgi:lysophospholipase L1-like esterase
MKLTFEQVQEIARGAVRISEDNGSFHFYRFTEAQTEAYLKTSPKDFYKKSFATAGIRLAFRTDSKRFAFDFKTSYASSREYAYFDVYVNGAFSKHFGCDGNAMMDGSANITLPEGEKTVEIYLPWSRDAVLSNIEIDDGATLSGVTRAKTMISFGDSITHGYDAINPSLSYASQLARLLDAEQVNKGIGGDIFFPMLLDEKDPFDPDYITVAYGTNDWSKCPRETFEANCRAFYTRLSALYPNAKIFAITPIWRGDWNRKVCGFGSPVTGIHPVISEICKDLPNVTVINPYNFVPQRKEFFADAYLHPNDLGFCLYAQGLYSEIVKHI